MKDENSKFYYYANKEIENKTYNIDLWRKSLALMGGNETKAKEKYIMLRILQLKRDGYQPKENTTKQTENKKKESKKENTQEKKSEPEEENDQKKIVKDDKQKYDNKNKTIKSIAGIVIWISIVTIVIWISNVVTNEEQSNSTTISSEYQPIEEKAQTVNDYIAHPDFMREAEETAREIKEKEAREEKEAADIEYLKAIQEMDEE